MDEERDSERQPLIVPSTSSGVPPPAYSTGATQHDREPLVINEVDASELPPPYTPSGYGSIPMINCKVCQAMISLEGKTNQHVVKCSVCNEATAIRPAPVGKKYVRCKCNCLLICKTASRRVVCPRESCKRLIILGLPANEIAAVSTDSSRIICIHCQQTFFFGSYHNALARCPHCRRVSSVGRKFARNRALLFLIPGILALITAVIVIAVTQAQKHSNGGIYAAYVVILLGALILLLRASYYCSIKVSRIEGSEVV